MFLLELNIFVTSMNVINSLVNFIAELATLTDCLLGLSKDSLTHVRHLRIECRVSFVKMSLLPASSCRDVIVHVLVFLVMATPWTQ